MTALLLITQAAGNRTPTVLAETSGIDATTFALEKRVYPTGDLLPGQSITYTLRYTNTGSLLAAPLTITDTVPFELFDVNFSAYPPITDTLASPRYVWQTSSISPTLGGIITITGRVTTTMTPPYTLQNQAILAANNVTQTTSNLTTNLVKLPQLTFTPAVVNIDEPDGSALITVKLTPINPYTTVTVTVATQDGSALASVDYTPVTQTFVFAPATTTRTLNVPILNNAIADGERALTLTMQSAANATAGSSATLTIVDDEQAGITLLGDNLQVSEDGITDTFSVTLQSQPIAPVEITVTPENTAVCQITNTPMTIAPSDWAQPIVFTVIGVENDIVDGGRACTLVISATSSDSNYQTDKAGTIDVVVADNDTSGLTLEVVEDGTSPHFTLRPTSQPAAAVIFTITPDDIDRCAAEPSPATLTPATWQSGITIAVGATADDNNVVACRFSITIRSDDASYDNAIVPPIDMSLSPQEAALSLTTNLGLAKDVDPCATSPGEIPGQITVEAGTDVIFCLTVENKGKAKLVSHTLTDTLFGTLFSGLKIDVSPGISTTYRLTHTVQTDESHTFTWTAEAAPNLQEPTEQLRIAQVIAAADTAQATITVGDPTNLPEAPQPGQSAPRLFLPSVEN